MPGVESPNKNNNAIIKHLLFASAFMAADRGRPKHRSAAKKLTVSLPAETYDFLALLAERGKLGPSEQDVAAHILIREVDLMAAIDYHEKRLPKLTKP